MAANSPGQQLNDLLVTRNFDPEALDARTGKPPLDDQGAPDPEAADMFTFDWVADSGKNYGTVVCLLGADNNFEVYFGDNLGRGMEFDDKADWYEFLDQLRNFAKRNLLRYDLQNLRRLKYTMAGMAAIKEGLFEGYYGNRKVSYAGEPTQARLMIKHDRTLGENDARFRYVESIFIETADGERFKLPFRKLAGGRAMLEHVRHGGTPYDARGQHIVEMVEQINVLSQFRRAHQGRVFEGAAGELVAETTEYLNRLRHNLKAVSNDRGYNQYFESWSPADVSESDLIVEDLKSLFVETRIDPRIEQALPMLARIQKEAQAMKEAEIFESWANRIVEGTWALPETPEQQDELKMLMSQPLVAGADGMNATEQLYGLVGDDELFDIIGEIAVDPDANIWDDERVQNRLEELGVYMVTPTEPAVAAETPPVAENGPYDLPGKDYDRPGEGPRRPPAGDEHNPYPFSPEEDDDYFRDIFRKKREASKQKGVAEGDMDDDEEPWHGIHDPELLQDLIADAKSMDYDDFHDTHSNLLNDTHEFWDHYHGGVAEGDNLATFEEAECNHTREGEYCPEHGLAECGNYGMYESELARIKSLAMVEGVVGAAIGGIGGALVGGPAGARIGASLGNAIGNAIDSDDKETTDEAIMVNPGTTIMNPDTEKMANPELEKHNTWQKQDAEADRIKWGGGGVPANTSAPQKSGLAAKPGDVIDVDAKEVEEGDIPPEFVSGARGQPTTLDVINYKDYTSDMKSNFGQDWKPDPKPTGPYDTAKLGSPRYSQPPVEESQDTDALLARIKSLAFIK